MRTRKLGREGPEITTVGFGAWAIGGGGWQFGWGPQDDQDSIRAIHRALDLGINWIDTAAVYGLGHSEEVVGRALKQRSGGGPLIATKCGLRWREDGTVYGHLKADSVRREAEDSLRRLGVECIDLYQVHWPNPDGDIEEAWGVLAELVREGKVRWAGVSNFSVAQMQRAQEIHPITSLQPPYSMLRRDIEDDVLPFCEREGIGVIVYSPMQAGLLTGAFSRERLAALAEDDWRRRDRFFQEPAFSQALDLLGRLRPLVADAGRSLAQLAVAWVLRRPEVTAAIVGARSPGQIEETAGAAEWDLAPEQQQEIEQALHAAAA